MFTQFGGAMEQVQLKVSARVRETLRRYGVALDYHPNYVKQRPEPHSVDVLLLSFIIRGHGQHVMEETVFEESGGSIGITYYGEMHDIITDANGMDIYNIFLDPTTCVLPALPAELREIMHVVLPQHQGFRNLLNRAIHLEIPEPERLAEVLALMNREIANPTLGSLEVVAACLRIFLIACCRAAQRSGIQPSHSADTPAWVGNLCTTIDTHYARPLTLDELAASVRFSPSYLCRAFKRHTGKTVFSYLIERRIQAAMLRLRTTDDKVIVIAMEVGFHDLAHFNRTFRQILGCSPTAYRRS